MLQPNASQSWRHCRFLSLRRAATPVATLAATLAATPAATKRLVNTFLRKVLNHSEKVGDIQTLFKQSNFHGNVHNQPNLTAAPFALDSSDMFNCFGIALQRRSTRLAKNDNDLPIWRP